MMMDGQESCPRQDSEQLMKNLKLLTPQQLIEHAEALGREGTPEAAIALYQGWLTANVSPLSFIIYFNLAVLLVAAGRHDEALQLYLRAIKDKPDLAEARHNLANLYELQGNSDAAIAQWLAVLALPQAEHQARRLLALNNLGRLLEKLKRYDEAETYLRQSLQQDSEQPGVIQHLVHLRQKQCKWPIYDPTLTVSIGQQQRHSSALAILAACDDPAWQLNTATRFLKEKINTRVPRLAPQQRYNHDRIRLGFTSSDFCLHAVSMLMVELFEQLDKSRFEVFGFCWSPEDGSPLRQRVISAMDHFFRVGDQDDRSVAVLIRNLEIDILIDLNSLTAGARPNIHAYKPAPLQMNYLGFPGTSGMPFCDYIIADRYLIPDHALASYMEDVLYLPGGFQPNDTKRHVGPIPDRAQLGLPTNKFVYCSFNNNFKYTEEMVDCWMRILARSPDSILWLLQDNVWARTNIEQKALSHGIDSQRLVFAGRAAPADYLARYGAADLFLDCFPFNAGTTSSDALWMELPVLTLSGRSFASRMAGSLLTTLGVPELITTDMQAYEDQAVLLAQDQAAYLRVKQLVQQQKQRSPLFDSPRFARHFEQALLQAYQGLPATKT